MPDSWACKNIYVHNSGKYLVELALNLTMRGVHKFTEYDKLIYASNVTLMTFQYFIYASFISYFH